MGNWGGNLSFVIRFVWTTAKNLSCISFGIHYPQHVQLLLYMDQSKNLISPGPFKKSLIYRRLDAERILNRRRKEGLTIKGHLLYIYRKSFVIHRHYVIVGQSIKYKSRETKAKQEKL